MQLSVKDLKDKYLGSYLGFLWAVIQPTISILIFWFIFQVGFKSMPVDNYPFILWLVAGIIPWFFLGRHYECYKLNSEQCLSCEECSI